MHDALTLVIAVPVVAALGALLQSFVSRRPAVAALWQETRELRKELAQANANVAKLQAERNVQDVKILRLGLYREAYIELQKTYKSVLLDAAKTSALPLLLAPPNVEDNDAAEKDSCG
ncbi:MAG: hypothetical protein ACJ741_06580 [Pyrinomonadaceae bacterium]